MYFAFCILWPDEQRRNSSSISQLPLELRSQLVALEAERENEVHAYELGDLVHIRGKLKLFRDMMEVVAYYHRILKVAQRIVAHTIVMGAFCWC